MSEDFLIAVVNKGVVRYWTGERWAFGIHNAKPYQTYVGATRAIHHYCRKRGTYLWAMARYSTRGEWLDVENGGEC